MGAAKKGDGSCDYHVPKHDNRDALKHSRRSKFI